MKTVDLDQIVLMSGSHAAAEAGMCAMELASFIADEPFSDHPKCVSGVLGAFIRSWNDAMNDEDRQKLKPLIPRLVGTAASDEIELQRSWLALDWSCRVSAPAWLKLAGLTTEAEALEALAPITDTASAAAAQDALNAAREKAYAARAAARDAARDAAWDAAWAAAWDAAWDAARAAAWAAARDAARAAAWAAAWDAARDAAWDAARAAAWAAARDAARVKLRPTVEQLQTSALDLVERMIACGQETTVS